MNKGFYKLMLVTNRQHTPLNDYLQFIERCALSGITAVQLREKMEPYSFLLTFGHALKRILDPLHIPLIINDSVQLALELDASGVHLGQTDGDPRQARNILGRSKIIGVSIDSAEHLIAANDLPLDYVGIGAIFPTANKHNVTTQWGLEGLQQLTPSSKHPIIGIGGINEHNAADVMLAGAHGIAVIGALHDAEDPNQTTYNLRHIINSRGKQHVA